MTRTLIRGAVVRAAIAVLVSYAVLAFAPNYTLADDRERLSSAPVVPSSSIAEQSFQVAQKKQGGGGGGGGQTCPTGYADCDGVKSNKCETNIGTDANNCGACGTACSFANATSACTNGTCQIAGCKTGYADCDGNLSNGCEANILTGTNAQEVIYHCGACGQKCGPWPNTWPACTNGTCGIARCSSGYSDCDGKLYNGCEIKLADDENNCGACGQKCGPLPNAYSSCLSGRCGITKCHSGYCDYDHVWSNGCEGKIVLGTCFPSSF